MSKNNKPPSLNNLKGEDILRFITAAQHESQRADRYLPWREIRYRKPPSGLSSEEWWWGIKLQRALARQTIPLSDTQDEPFSYALNPCMHRLLHVIDKLCGGAREGDRKDITKSTYLLHSLEEESIMSSIVEGAVTTRAEAKAMIRQKRRPLNLDERMVYNNYKAMQFIQQERDTPFSPESILELHRLLTHATLDDAKKEGNLRSCEDQVRVENSLTHEIIHLPPNALELPLRIEMLCEFANEAQTESQEDFIHPLVRACIIHFWLAYDHPFIDGNGRTARALFYWSVLKAGYRDFEYISISREILNHPSVYYASFVDTEQDQGDLNYFIIKQLAAVHQAVESLHQYIRNKQEDQMQLRSKLRDIEWLNLRQQALLVELLRDTSVEYSAAGAADIFQVTKQTARNDLNVLTENGLLTIRSKGNVHLYGATADLEKRLRAMLTH